MKKLLLAGLFMTISMMAFSQKKGFKVSVKANIEGCWVALINKKDAEGAEYGWWSIWQDIKKNKKYKNAPATFADVAQGTYIVVVYNPASANFDPNNGNSAEASDGVVMEEVQISKNASFNIKKTEFKSWYCLSCPYLCVWNGNEYAKMTEVIKDVVGKRAETTTQTHLAYTQILQNTLKIRIQEEKEETSYLNSVVLKVGNQTYFPVQASLQNIDTQYHTLQKGDMIEIAFELKGEVSSKTPIILETTGYYEPNAQFLSEIYQKYLRNK